MQVLVYDPDRLRLSTISRNLRELGLTNTTVSSINELRKTIQKKQFDIMILDETALGLLDQFKKQHGEVPIIVVADRNSIMNYERAIFAGIAGLLLRPYRRDFLLRVVDKAMKRRNEIICNRQTVLSQ
jgi:DNA-binding NtrC family response regulator